MICSSLLPTCFIESPSSTPKKELNRSKLFTCTVHIVFVNCTIATLQKLQSGNHGCFDHDIY